MAHEVRTNADAFYVNGQIIPRGTFEDIDLKQFRSINGDQGGCYSPTSQIHILGAQGLVCTGLAEVRGDGVLIVSPLTATPGAIVLGDNDFQDLMPGHVGRSRKLLQSTIPFLPVGDYPWAMSVNAQYASAQPLCGTIEASNGDETTPEFLVPLRVHNGATLDKVVFSFRVPELRTNSPATMPRFRVFRRDADGNVDEMKLTTAGDGFASPDNPATASAWYQDGHAQTFEYVCDQNNLIDTSLYTYYADIVEESDAPKFPLRLKLYTVTPILAATSGASPGGADVFTDHAILHGDGTCDGVVIGYDTGPFINSVSIFASARGIYQMGSGSDSPWIRYPKFDTEDAISAADGLIFYVGAGTLMGGRALQMQVQKPFTLGTSEINFVQPLAHGNVYHPIELYFSGIVDTRWQ